MYHERVLHRLFPAATSNIILPLGVALILCILAGFVIAGPVVLRSVENTEQQVTELWLALLRFRENQRIAGTDGEAAGEIREILEVSATHLEENPFFETIQLRNPDVGLWLSHIETGVSALLAGEEPNTSELRDAFRRLDSFISDHAQRQYRALQTVIWSALMLLLGVAMLFTYLYVDNRRLLTSLKEALDTKSQLVRETHHRVKNTLSLVASLVKMKEHALGPEADLRDLRNRISAIGQVHDLLAETGTALEVPMREYLEELVATVLDSMSGPVVDRSVEIEPVDLPAKKAVAVGMIVNELITNAAKHAFSDSQPRRLEVSLRTGPQMAVLRVSNSGIPLPSDFSMEGTSSLGFQLVSGLADQLSGTLRVEREPMTEFVLTFPV